MTALATLHRARKGGLAAAFAAIACFAGGAAGASTTPKQYPHVGDIYYGGANYADSIFSSHAPYGNYVTNTFWSDPGLEIDINMGTVYFDACTSWSDMPKFYDDCVTAGVSETGSARSFGIGTYDLRLLRQGQSYTGEWNFSGGSGASAAVTVSWQEVWKDFCPAESPWCMNSNAGGRFLSTTWTYGTTDLKTWNY